MPASSDTPLPRASTCTAAVSGPQTNPNFRPGEVLSFLFLGNVSHASSEALLAQLKISHVLTVTEKSEFTPVNDARTRLQLHVRDSSMENISVLFPKAIGFINAVETAGGCCLVHCIEGRSRSATICLAFLMVHQNVSLLDAWQHVQVCRPEAFPNPGFWRQLQSYEQQLHGCCSELPPSVSRWLSKFGDGEATTPQSVFSEYLSAKRNECTESRRCALSAWSEDWGTEAVMELLVASCEKLATEARRIVVQMLEDLCTSRRLALMDVVAALTPFLQDEELAEDMRLDVPQFDSFRLEVAAAAQEAGLFLSIEPPPAIKDQLSKNSVSPKLPIDRASSAPNPPLDRDYFAFPDGETWSLPVSWGCRERANIWKKKPLYRIGAFVAVRQNGDQWRDEAGELQVYDLSPEFKVMDLPLQSIQKPRRQRPRGSRHGCGIFLERPRLERVLDAMIRCQALPPVSLKVSAGARAEVSNGFHRYFASLILGFTEVPVLVPRWYRAPRRKGRDSPLRPKKAWIPPSVRQRMAEEAAKREAERRQRRCLRRHEGIMLKKSSLYDEQLAKMHHARRNARKNWSWVVRNRPSQSSESCAVGGEHEFPSLPSAGIAPGSCHPLAAG